uniref:Uncharacterized protein n=1 Tax=Moniliophthora roreri TaxID=221103 RepID=A0A0W0EX63_MONRR
MSSQNPVSRPWSLFFDILGYLEANIPLCASDSTKACYCACGKTSLLCSFALGEFPKEYQPTVFDNYVAEIRLDEKHVQLALWDTAGQEEYERLRPMSYSKSHVILIAFALDTPDSLENVETKWIEEVRSICGPTIPVILVGCKADLRPNTSHPNTPDNPAPWVTREQGERVAQRIGARAYKECSALKIEGVDDVFETATRASMLMRDGVPSSSQQNTEGRHHRRRSSGKSGIPEETGKGWKCCVLFRRFPYLTHAPILEIFPVDSTALASKDASNYLLYMNTLMKNVLIRALSRITEFAPSMNGNNIKFEAFVGYVVNFCDMLRDEMFFISPNKQGVKLVDVLGPACNPRNTDKLEAALDELRKGADQWKMVNSIIRDSADTLSNFAKVMMGTMTGQRSAIQNSALKIVEDEELRNMILENIKWIQSKSDITVLLPFILAHHDAVTAPEWPTMADDSTKELPHIIEVHAEWWQFAPFDPITREKKTCAV